MRGWPLAKIGDGSEDREGYEVPEETENELIDASVECDFSDNMVTSIEHHHHRWSQMGSPFIWTCHLLDKSNLPQFLHTRGWFECKLRKRPETSFYPFVSELGGFRLLTEKKKRKTNCLPKRVFKWLIAQNAPKHSPISNLNKTKNNNNKEINCHYTPKFFKMFKWLPNKLLRNSEIK